MYNEDKTATAEAKTAQLGGVTIEWDGRKAHHHNGGRLKISRSQNRNLAFLAAVEDENGAEKVLGQLLGGNWMVEFEGDNEDRQYLKAGPVAGGALATLRVEGPHIHAWLQGDARATQAALILGASRLQGSERSLDAVAAAADAGFAFRRDEIGRRYSGTLPTMMEGNSDGTVKYIDRRAELQLEALGEPTLPTGFMASLLCRHLGLMPLVELVGAGNFTIPMVMEHAAIMQLSALEEHQDISGKIAINAFIRSQDQLCLLRDGFVYAAEQFETDEQADERIERGHRHLRKQGAQWAQKLLLASGDEPIDEERLANLVHHGSSSNLEKPFRDKPEHPLARAIRECQKTEAWQKTRISMPGWRHVIDGLVSVARSAEYDLR